MNVEIESDYILKLHYGSDVHKLAMVMCRMDCSIYILVTDMPTDSSQIIETGLFIEGPLLRRIIENFEGRKDYTNNFISLNHKITSITRPYDGLFSRNADYYSITNHTGEVKTFHFIYHLLSFEADFENSRFLLEGIINDFTINLSTIEEKSTRQVMIYDQQGYCYSKKLDIEYNQQYNERDYTRFIDENNIICYDSDPYSYKLHILNLETGKTFDIDIDDENTGKEKTEFYYEYIREIQFRQNHSLVAYTCDNPTYGCTGIRILKIDAGKPYAQNIFSFDAYDHKPLNLREPDEVRETFLFLAIDINQTGQRAAVMRSASKQNTDYSYSTSYSIYIFNVQDGKAPLKIIDACSDSSEFDFIYFLTDAVVVVRFYSVFSFYDIATGENIKNIPFKKFTGFHVSKNYLVYIDNNSLCMVYVDKDGKVIKLDNPLRM
ncbi:hypothetical protein HYN59_05285 [Flavobacterium album]|uniref:Uncharacterized protein n=1 Tax=Flavobacterium album TaxID=2175091 RepID=A0A2S1QVX0_9FLAO|nr:hypothetical protein [Flavobacterium album]AWH84567.1 hypothetical protein HYN59_05285 [Flavobacterium album]